ncbi:MAG: FkbM family methyltransferase [Phycisphaerales bacterium]|nr:FkbM family methyltransferase [Phycisphaerales bacterium]
MGNEVQGFLDHGFERILLIEANPTIADQLQKRFAMTEQVTVVNAAVSDTEGMCRFNIATGDGQSSSILDPTMHKKIYKGIQFKETIEVRASTLDTLVRESGFDPAQFNMIVLDIQGAEIMALRGATKQLKHIDAVLSEFSNVELYKDSGTGTDLRALLEGHGLHIAAEEVNWHPTWGDFFFVRRPIIQMSTLGSNGRFANQLFQYAYLHIAAKQLGAVIQTPPWIGHELYQLPYALCTLENQETTTDANPAPAPEVVQEEVKERGQSNDKKFAQIKEILDTHDIVDVIGYYQEMSFFAPHREELRKLFTLAQPWRDLINEVLDTLKALPGPLVAIHLRRGDFGFNQFYRAPYPWYTAWIDELIEPNTPAIVYISSEDPEPYRSKFAKYTTYTATDFPSVPKQLHWLLDFEILRAADHIALSNSSFSFMAAFLNPSQGIKARPCMKSMSLIPCDPSMDRVFSAEMLSPSDHKQLVKLDKL